MTRFTHVTPTLVSTAVQTVPAVVSPRILFRYRCSVLDIEIIDTHTVDPGRWLKSTKLYG